MITLNPKKGDRVKVNCAFCTIDSFGQKIRFFYGTVRHVKDNYHPDDVRIFVDPESPTDLVRSRPSDCICGEPHVQVHPKQIVMIQWNNF